MVDTAVLIDCRRDQPQAVTFLEGSDQPLAPFVSTIAALDACVRDGEERQRLDAFVAAFDVLALDRQSAQRAGIWRWKFGPSHGTGLADVLIAASVEAAGATLVRLDRCHFPMPAEVLVSTPRAEPGRCPPPSRHPGLHRRLDQRCSARRSIVPTRRASPVSLLL